MALDGHIEEPFLRDQRGIVIMFRVFQIDEVSPLEPENPDPLELRSVAGVVVLFDTRINTSPAADAPGKFKTIPP